MSSPRCDPRSVRGVTPGDVGDHDTGGSPVVVGVSTRDP